MITLTLMQDYNFNTVSSNFDEAIFCVDVLKEERNICKF